MSPVADKLAEILSQIRHPGDFYTAGRWEMLAPRLEVEGVGPVALPLLPIQAEQLIAVALQAPYGRGEETLVNTEVRRTWQIDAGRVRIQGQGWARSLEGVLAQVVAGLGVTGQVSAELYKLLVYDTGSFFVSHRDTEKAPGMFATLVLALPSDHVGGELLVRHGEREVRLSLCSDEPAELAYAAFYADCRHQVLPVTAGYRLVLIYNLIRQGSDPLPGIPEYVTERVRLTELLRHWDASGEAPDKLVYPLEHAYTPAALAFADLKGEDAAAAPVLTEAAAAADCELYLALLAVEESGGAEYTGEGHWSDPDLEAGEVYEHSATLSAWQRPDGTQPDLGSLPFDEDHEVSPPGALEGVDYEEEFQEATGNEGASFERSYHHAALVLWPRTRRLAVFNQAGLTMTLPHLKDLAQRWEASGRDSGSPVWQEAHTLTGLMLDTWPQGHGSFATQAMEMLATLVRLGDVDRITALLAGPCAGGALETTGLDALHQVFRLLPPAGSAELLRTLVEGNAARKPGVCAALLARLSADSGSRGSPGLTASLDLRPAALALSTNLQPNSSLRPWERPMVMESSFVIDWLSALGRSGADDLARDALELMLTQPQSFDKDAVLLPAALDLAGQAEARQWEVVQTLVTTCLDHLRRRIAEPLAAPSDWTRKAAMSCHCPYCTDLERFLQASNRREWILKSNEIHRKHVEQIIHEARCDLDLTTHRNSRPYSLVCVKNQASYERRAVQRRQDLERCAALETAIREA
ncbi:MAG: 2OG-Fe(II) oxygenase [Pseudomonadota bacterium]